MISPVRVAMAAALAASFATGAAGGEPRTIIDISTVMASNQTRNFDARLTDLRSELRSLRFKSYRLVGTESRLVKGNGDVCGIELPGNRYLHITTHEHTTDHLRMHVLLNESNRPLINTDIKLESGSVVLLGGPRGPDGTLIITIGAKSAPPETKGRREIGRAARASKQSVNKQSLIAPKAQEETQQSQSVDPSGK